MGNNIKYGNRPNNDIVSIINKIGTLDKREYEEMKYKLNMIGIQCEEVVNTKSGVKIIEFNSDGLVDIDKDWEIPDEYEAGPDYIDTTCRLYGLDSSVEEKELIESCNYMCVRELPYGLYILNRGHEICGDDFTADELMGYTHEGKDGIEYLDMDYRVVILDSTGKVIANTVTEKSENQEQFIADTSEFFKGIANIRKSIVEHIIKHGSDESDIYEDGYRVLGGRYSTIGDGTGILDMQVIHSEDYKYQLMLMGGTETYIDAAFVLFDLETGECIAHSESTSVRVNTDEDIYILVDDTGIVVLDLTYGVMMRHDEIRVPKNTRYWFKDSIGRTVFSDRESLLDRSEVLTAVMDAFTDYMDSLEE